MEKKVPGAEALKFQNSDFTWAVSSYLDRRDTFAKKSFIYSLTISIILITIYSYFGKMAITVKSEGKLISEQDITNVASLTNFQVSKVLVNEGELIEKGQVIALSKFALNESELKSLNESISNQIISVKKSIEECLSCEVLIRSFLDTDLKKFQEGQISLELRDLFLSGERYIQVLKSRSKFKDNFSDLISQIETIDKKINKIEKTRNKKLLRNEYNELVKERTSLKAEFNRQKEESNNQIKELQTNYLKMLESTLPIVQKYNLEQALIAPTNGIVYDLKVKSGEIVKAGEVALVLLPEQIKLLGEVYIANKDIGEVKVGQQVKMSITALPEREYGALFGVIESLSADVKPVEQKGNFYIAKVVLQEQFLVKNDKKYEFKLGMEFDGQIIKKRQRILYVALQKMLNLKDEMFGD